jgi:hypothetical protein
MIAVLFISAVLYAFVRFTIWFLRDVQRQTARYTQAETGRRLPVKPKTRRQRPVAVPGDDLIVPVPRADRWTALDDHQLTRLLSDAAAR